MKRIKATGGGPQPKPLRHYLISLKKVIVIGFTHSLTRHSPRASRRHPPIIGKPMDRIQGHVGPRQLDSQNRKSAAYKKASAPQQWHALYKYIGLFNSLQSSASSLDLEHSECETPIMCKKVIILTAEKRHRYACTNTAE